MHKKSSEKPHHMLHGHHEGMKKCKMGMKAKEGHHDADHHMKMMSHHMKALHKMVKSHHKKSK